MAVTNVQVEPATTERFVAFPLPDGSYFQIRHLPADVVLDIERDFGLSWLYIIDAPQIQGRVLQALAIAVAIENDLEPPAIATIEDLVDISDSLVVVDSDGNRIFDAELDTSP